jgi:glutaredoxin
MYKIFSTNACPKCEQLKDELKKEGIKFIESDISTPESLTELAVNGVFTLSAPVLKVDECFYTVKELFTGDKLKNIRSLS